MRRAQEAAAEVNPDPSLSVEQDRSCYRVVLITLFLRPLSPPVSGTQSGDYLHNTMKSSEK